MLILLQILADFRLRDLAVRLSSSVAEGGCQCVSIFVCIEGSGT